MQIKEVRSQPREVTVETVCDSCGKRGDGYDPLGWHHFSSGHHEWGNDSIESVESHDVCSAPCFIAIVHDLVKDAPSSFYVDDFDIEFLRSLVGHVSISEPA